MFMKRVWKQAALAGLLLLIVLVISGCFSKPDKIEELPEETGSVEPFQVTTPSPSPAPTEEGQWQDFSSGEPVTLITNPPTAVPTIGLITASPTPQPAITSTPQPATAAPTASPKPTDDGLLRNGSTGEAVRSLQQKLKELGYYSGSVDGDFGAGTESALKDFQRANGLSADGVAGSKTLTALSGANAKPKATPTKNAAYATSRPSPVTYKPSELENYNYIQLGTSGQHVTRLQNRLKELGYFNGTVNGIAGDDTVAAIEAFQKRNGEWVDGVAGEDTQKRLFSNDALPASKGGGALPAEGYRTLQSGLEGDDVALLQTRLKELGYYDGAVDGKYGPSTATAVNLFQQFNGMTADGVAASGTLARIYSTNALYAPTYTATETRVAAGATMELGSMGEDVYRLQERLYDLGYYSGRIDGIYTEDVAAAVRAFQMANKLTGDGKAGRNTQTKLYGETAIAAATQGEAFATLRQGDSGERVRALQTLLATYGYYTDTVTGTYDLATQLSVQQFQLQNGLASDGIAGPATLQLLYQGTPQHAVTIAQDSTAGQTNYTTLKQGMSGPDVTMLQQFLLDFGYFFGDLNGEYDALTLIAVQAFQSRNNLTADGVAGPETLSLLYSGNGEPSDSFGQVLYGSLLTPLQEAAEEQRTKLQSGDEGQDVYSMQERLFTLGYLLVSPDGKFGTSTLSAVQLFQEKNGLKADGIVGKDTLSAMYSATAVPNKVIASFEAVDNSTRELGEQDATGAIQGSLAGGGIAASHGSTTYYVGPGGTLYARGSSGSRQVYNGKAAFIHASDKGVTFASGNKILRIPTGGGSAQTLVTAGNIKKLSVMGDSLLYLDGSTLLRARVQGDPVEIAKGVNDFTIDVYQSIIYMATTTGLRSISTSGMGDQLISSTPADQVQIADSVIFFRSGGSIYRLQDGIASLFLDANASWMGIYRGNVFYISAGKLYRCDTDGANNGIFYDGNTADVSFVAGRVYISQKSGGEVAERIDLGPAAP